MTMSLMPSQAAAVAAVLLEEAAAVPAMTAKTTPVAVLHTVRVVIIHSTIITAYARLLAVVLIKYSPVARHRVLQALPARLLR